MAKRKVKKQKRMAWGLDDKRHPIDPKVVKRAEEMHVPYCNQTVELKPLYDSPDTGLFPTHACASLSRVFDTFAERSSQYGDTWRDCQHLTLRAVYKKLTGYQLDPQFCRALAAAVMVDVKHQRNEGGYKDDTIIDGIAYSAFLAEEMRKLLSVNG